MATRRNDFHRTVGWLLALLCAAFLFAACGDDDSGGGDAGTDTDTDTDSDTDTGSDTDTDTTGTDSISFVVMQSTNFGDPMWVPFPGATVAFDAPGGARIEQTTDADGKVTFTGFDWAEGTASATAYAAGYALFTYTNMDAATVTDHNWPTIDGAVEMFVYDMEALATMQQDLVEVSGTLTGVQDAAAHDLLLNVGEAGYGSQVYASDDGTFAMDVPANRPFSIQAFETVATSTLTHEGYTQEIHQVASVHFDGLDAGVEGIAIDFAADGLTTQAVDTSVTLPTRAESPLRAANVICGVPDLFSFGWIGWATSVAIAEDGNSYEATLEWWEPGWSEHPMMWCSAQTEGGRFLAQTTRFGTPEAVPIGALLDVPEWVTPATTAAHPLHDPIEWSYTEAAPTDYAWFRVFLDGKVVWSVKSDPDATSLTVPEMPSGADAAEVLGSVSLGADLSVANGLNVETGWHEQLSTSSLILVHP